ncbi:MAG: hypothetical protein ACO3ZG_09800, partial [Kiritimatiellia bacterium]
ARPLRWWGVVGAPLADALERVQRSIACSSIWICWSRPHVHVVDGVGLVVVAEAGQAVAW